MFTGSTQYDYFDEDYHLEQRDGWSKNIHAPKGVHIMNKNERKALSKLKRETGLTEEQLRKEKPFRKALSEAQKAKGSKTEVDRRVIDIVKSATRKLKLAVDHPLVKEEIGKLIEKSGWPFYYPFNSRPSIDFVINRYKNLRKKQKNG